MWIKVSEKLPEKDGWYLIYTHYQGFESRGWQTDSMFFEGGKFCSGGHKRPTHWQPLPQPPEEE